MTPKEKATELVMKFEELEWEAVEGNAEIGITYFSVSMPKIAAIYAALISVNEILRFQPRYPSNVDWDDVGSTYEYYCEAQMEEANRFWNAVKDELERQSVTNHH